MDRIKSNEYARTIDDLGFNWVKQACRVLAEYKEAWRRAMVVGSWHSKVSGDFIKTGANDTSAHKRLRAAPRTAEEKLLAKTQARQRAVLRLMERGRHQVQQFGEGRLARWADPSALALQGLPHGPSS